jgi:hypothetical protein
MYYHVYMHHITEILLEVALNTINLTLTLKPGDILCNIQYEYFPSRGLQCIFISIRSVPKQWLISRPYNRRLMASVRRDVDPMIVLVSNLMRTACVMKTSSWYYQRLKPHNSKVFECHKYVYLWLQRAIIDCLCVWNTQHGFPEVLKVSF